jgi:hypothetical protein
MEPKYLQIRQNNRDIQFRVDIERRFAYSEYSIDYFDYYIRINDEYVDSGASSDLLLAVDDYHNIRIYDNFMKEYVLFEIDELNHIYYTYETLKFSGITLEQLVKEILYQKFVGASVRFDV